MALVASVAITVALPSIYSGGGNGVDNACDAWIRLCGDSVYGTCDHLDHLDDVF